MPPDQIEGEDVCGFVVVRRPEHHLDPQFYPLTPPRIGEMYYGGVQRMAWFDLSEAAYERGGHVEEYRALGRLNDDFFGIKVTQDLATADRLLRVVPARASQNEIIAVDSPELRNVKGVVRSPAPITWRGWDVLVVGEWSLIGDGVFVKPNLFEDVLPKLNQHGLLSQPEDATDVIEAYMAGVSRGQLEPFGEQPHFYALRVGGVVL